MALAGGIRAPPGTCSSFKTPWYVMTSVNIAPIQFYDKENDVAIKSHNIDIRVAAFFFYKYGWLFLWNNFIVFPWSFVSVATPVFYECQVLQ